MSIVVHNLVCHTRYMSMAPRVYDILFTIQTRLHCDVILPLWDRRAPRESPPEGRASRVPAC